MGRIGFAEWKLMGRKITTFPIFVIEIARGIYGIAHKT
jgi:hypothetical protein